MAFTKVVTIFSSLKTIDIIPMLIAIESSKPAKKNANSRMFPKPMSNMSRTPTNENALVSAKSL